MTIASKSAVFAGGISVVSSLKHLKQSQQIQVKTCSKDLQHWNAAVLPAAKMSPGSQKCGFSKSGKTTKSSKTSVVYRNIVTCLRKFRDDIRIGFRHVIRSQARRTISPFLVECASQ